MMVSTKGRYALRMITDLARNADNGFVSLKEISERQHISKKYLEQIVPMLSRNGLLRTNRGNKGGYALGKSAETITVGEVIRATEGTLSPVACLDREVNDCPRASECETLFVWEGLLKLTTEYLDGITVQDIVSRTSGESSDNYVI